MTPKPLGFNILIVGQSGRLAAEAVLFAASLRHSDPGSNNRLFVADVQRGDLWKGSPSLDDASKQALTRLGAKIVPLKPKVFGKSYPYGNKIEALRLLPEGEPFVFFDTDTLVTGPLSTVPFDFDVPSASERVTGTWPKPTLYGPGMEDIWGSLYRRFDLDFDASKDPSQPVGHWRHYLYFNAGWFYYKCPKVFGDLFLEYARAIGNDPPKELIGQVMSPWLDQVALPLVIHRLGGGRGIVPSGLLDGTITCHYRALPLLYAREDARTIEMLEEIAAPNWIKKVLKQHEPFKKMIFQKKGAAVRALFEGARLPKTEDVLRRKIRKAGLWMR